MRVVIVGNGGREASLAWRIASSEAVDALATTGPNPGWPAGTIVLEAEGPGGVVTAAQRFRADLVVVGPEAPLGQGLADDLVAAGIPCFGPQRAAARLETSKAFAKEVMGACRVPTAGHLEVRRGDAASVAAGERRIAEGRVVVKADGLAAGKGVFVCHTADQARAAWDEAWSGRFGTAADTLLLEDLLVGPEVSVFALTDGERVVPLLSAQDHKRLGDGDQGPNTGGMGAYGPCPLVTASDVDRIVDEVHRPVLRELARRGTPFRGVLFGGLMLTPDGPRVLEFNVRFGDPECQVLMALWDGDVVPWLHGAATGRLPPGRPRFVDGAAICVVLASAGYPRTSTRGVMIPEPTVPDGVHVFHSGTRRGDGGELLTDGGRVLGVTAVGRDVRAARDRAYPVVERWRFDGAQVRTDIGHQAL